MDTASYSDTQETIVASDAQGEKIKVMVAGDKGAGKTQLMRSLLNIDHGEETDRMIMAVDFFIARIPINERTRQRLYVWITAGELTNPAMVIPFLKQCHIYVIVFALDDAKSLTRALDVWFVQCFKNSRKSKAYFLFIGNKSDAERQCPTTKEIEQQIMQALIEQLRQSVAAQRLSFPDLDGDNLPEQVKYQECSANTGDGIAGTLKVLQRVVLELQRKESEGSFVYESALNINGTNAHRDTRKNTYIKLHPDQEESGCLKGRCS